MTSQRNWATEDRLPQPKEQSAMNRATKGAIEKKKRVAPPMPAYNVKSNRLNTAAHAPSCCVRSAATVQTQRKNRNLAAIDVAAVEAKRNQPRSTYAEKTT